MGVFDEIKTQGASYRLTEEALYAKVLREMELNQRRDGQRQCQIQIWTQTRQNPCI